ncbi:unnamed protein product [Diplocarpon coronariae]|uniref:DUF6697 domain-containing protein n=1 Tax=Diplocarpon coronariae TaxID=2795749 RepID=A0A218YXV1_9HELO|nr:hypothetical protein B2J93_5437 [Marssonina coronariae]
MGSSKTTRSARKDASKKKSGEEADAVSPSIRQGKRKRRKQRVLESDTDDNEDHVPLHQLSPLPLAERSGRGEAPLQDEPLLVLERVQAQLEDIRQQQALERDRIQNVLDLHNSRLSQLHEAIHGQITASPVSRPLPVYPKPPEPYSDSDFDAYDASPRTKRGVPAWKKNDRDDSPASGQSDVKQSDPASRGSRMPGSVTQAFASLCSGMRMPAVIDRLAPCDDPHTAQNHQTFTSASVWHFFGHRNGLATGNISSRIHAGSRGGLLFPGLHSFRLIHARDNPFLPQVPGQHGATILLEIPPEYNVEPFALFIRFADSDSDCRYFGTYKELRKPDAMSCGEMAYAPDHMKRNWARKLGKLHKSGSKSRTTIDFLKANWPREPVGWLDGESNQIIKYDPRLQAVHGDPMTSQISDLVATQITTTQVLEAFETPDLDQSPSLRPYYQYFECIGYDMALYEALVSECGKFDQIRQHKKSQKKRKKHAEAEAARAKGGGERGQNAVKMPAE